MAIDKHLKTGEYDPEKYWSARARHSEANLFNAVCVFSATELENRCADRVQQNLMRKAFKIIRKTMDLRRKKVLEYGCGVGRWIKFFKSYPCSWVGVDISEDMLNIAISKNKSIELLKTTSDHIPYPDKCLDVVYSVTVIHHNPYDVQEKIVSEMKRVLRDDGYLILFEDMTGATGFNMFPRKRSDWVALAGRHGMEPVWYRGAKYWILREMVVAFNQKLSRRSGSGKLAAILDKVLYVFKSEVFRKLINRLDFIVDPYLLPFLPSDYQTTAIMVFKKKQ